MKLKYWSKKFHNKEKTNMNNKQMAKQLQARSNITQEVKDILTGHGFQANRPKYTSKQDI